MSIADKLIEGLREGDKRAELIVRRLIDRTKIVECDDLTVRNLVSFLQDGRMDPIHPDNL